MDTTNLPSQRIHGNVFAKHLARDEDRNFQIDIIEIAPNTPLGTHTHLDIEWVYVVEGSFSDENAVYTKDAFVLFPKNSKHTSIAGPTGCKLIRCWCGMVLTAK